MNGIALTGQNPSTFQSPIRDVLKHLPSAIVNIAPENESKILREFSGLKIEFVDSDTANWSADSINNHIIIRRALAESIWATVYGSFMFYDKIVAGKTITKPTEINLSHFPELAPALELMKWGIEITKKGHYRPWPNHLPAPQKKSEYTKAANEFCLGAMATIALHEFGHVILNHTKRQDYIENLMQEQDADRYAIEWIFGGEYPTRQHYEKRLLCAGLGFLHTCIIDLHDNSNSSENSHPMSHDRLFNFLEEHSSTTPGDFVFSLATAVLKLNLDDTGVQTKDILHDTQADFVNYVVDILSKRRSRIM